MTNNSLLIPEELIKLTQWVLYDREKVPIDYRTGGRASCTSPPTWGPFEDCLKAYIAGTYPDVTGLGFVLTPECGYSCIDLDHCKKEDGRLTETASLVVSKFRTYTEHSPSKTGLHVWLKGKLPVAGKRKNGIEIYSSNRYLTVTGDHFSESPLTVEDCQEALDWLYDYLWPEQEIKQAANNHTTFGASDEEILSRLMHSENCAKFNKLFAGNGDDYASESEADAALVALIGFYTRDSNQGERLMLKSALKRPKWQERRGKSTYLRLTIENILKLPGESYNGEQKKNETNLWTPKWVTGEMLEANDYPPPDYLVPDILSRPGVAILAAKPKMGKTVFAQNLSVATLFEGTAFRYKEVCHSGRVLYIDFEGDEGEHKERLKKMTSCRLPADFMLTGDWPRITHGGLDALERELDKFKNTRLVVIDPFAMFKLLPKKGREGYEHEYEAFLPLNKLAKERNVNILLNHHTKKGRCDDIIDEVLGSIAIAGVVQTILVLSNAAGGSAKLTVRPRRGRHREFAMRYHEDVYEWEVLGDASEVFRRSERVAVIEVLKMNNKRMSPLEIALAMEMTDDKGKGAIRKLVWTMFNDGELQKDEKGRYYVGV